ncbi:putative conserved protein, Ntn-hydrolase superfamily [Prauserella aidingensis]|uniref:DUF1028 domain-containing protein n=1 Tax=Prauserella aidingensis TaxID=387890 RepID=UPI0020A23849|nr:DUF1028 domain-containing protein [Prauserella aidingensis]MCP2253359.1 putative conserved protein, Ntn-hydrolase superfamily [Prauserella aidingensis]
MTFSLAARDPDTGAFGIVVSSSSPAVAARCAHVRAGVGAVTSQNVTNPDLGRVGLEALASGAGPADAVCAMVAADGFPEYRQLSAVSVSGETAAHSGAETLGTHTSVTGDAAVVAGNLLATESVAHAMLGGYTGSRAEAFEERLLDGYAAALAAGGEEGPVRSVGLVVAEDVPWAVTDLRVDDADEPFGELLRLWQLWAPQKAAYRLRGLDPRRAPSYGVPGDA